MKGLRLIAAPRTGLKSALNFEVKTEDNLRNLKNRSSKIQIADPHLSFQIADPHLSFLIVGPGKAPEMRNIYQPMSLSSECRRCEWRTSSLCQVDCAEDLN